jgi:hypothetical protein
MRERGEKFIELLFSWGVNIDRWFIKYKDLRISSKGTSDEDPLSFSAREFTDWSVCK